MRALHVRYKEKQRRQHPVVRDRLIFDFFWRLKGQQPGLSRLGVESASVPFLWVYNVVFKVTPVILAPADLYLLAADVTV